MPSEASTPLRPRQIAASLWSHAPGYPLGRALPQRQHGTTAGGRRDHRPAAFARLSPADARAQGHVATWLAMVPFPSLRLGRPLFLEGEAGAYQTEIAKAIADPGRRLIRLQC